jgi:hypothetical protein
MAAMGKSSTEIARDLDLNEKTVGTIRQSPLMVQLIASKQQEMEQRTIGHAASALAGLVPKAVRRMEELLQQDDELPVAARMVDSVLDRYFPKRQQQDVEHTVNVTLGPDLVAQLTRALTLDSDPSTLPIDITPEDPAIPPTAEDTDPVGSVDGSPRRVRARTLDEVEADPLDPADQERFSVRHAAAAGG